MKARIRLLMLLAAALLFAAVAEGFILRSLGPMRGIFVQLAGSAILCALGTVLCRNLIHSALYLVAFFFLVACLFVMLEAEFLAAMQVLVFIGAVSILLMFGIMLTNDVHAGQAGGRAFWARLPAALVAAGLFAMLVIGIEQRPVVPSSRLDRATASVEARDAVVDQLPRVLGLDLMQRWCLPFELMGLLLTAGVVGAVALAQPGLSVAADGPNSLPSRGGTTRGPSEDPEGSGLVVASVASFSSMHEPVK